MLIIKEFDTITCNIDYKNDEYLTYLDKDIFADFDKFVRENTSEDDETVALDFFRAFAKKGVGDVIQARNYVGLVQLESGYQIQVLPKIDFIVDDEADSITTKVFLKMLRSMKDFPGKVYNTANLKTDRMNLYEIFISMYIQQVAELTKRGLKSAYIPINENLNFYKGKLLFNEHIKKNMVHKEKFYVSYDEFQINRAENRLIKSTLIKLQKISSNSSNIKAIRQLLVFFEMVDASTNYVKDFSEVVIDRNTKDYEDIMIWSKVFLMNKSFSTFTGDTNSRALLFPMEKVYEAYVAQNMKRVLGEIDWDVSTQDRGYYLFEENNRNIFALRPDIVVTREDGHQIIMDTKWKRLINDGGKNYGISQADMYQMFAYSKKYNTPDIWLLYPKTEEIALHEDITFKSYEVDGSYVNVSLFFVDVTDIEMSLKKLRSKLV
jgi:5-methylcytosine-specific restriction enzyme subunit McrC